MFNDSLRGAVLGNEFCCRLDSNTDDARNVIDVITHEALNLDGLLGQIAFGGFKGGRVDYGVFGRIVELHSFADELLKIFVFADQKRLNTLLLEAPRQGRQYVIGFIVRDGQYRHADRF